MSLSTRTTTGGFSPVTMIIVVLVSIMALAGVGVLSAYTPELRSGNDGGGHALSRAATGYAGLPTLLRSLGTRVFLDRGSPGPATEDSLLVLTPGPEIQPKLIEEIEHDGPLLIVLPKWRAVDYPRRPGWVRTAGVYPGQESLAPLPRDLRRGLRLAERKGRSTVDLRRPNGDIFGAPVQVEGLRTLSGPDWIPVVVDDKGAAVLVLHRHKFIYVLADPDLVSTHGLKTLAGARTAVALIDLLRDAETPVVFDLTLHGFTKGRNVLRLLLEPPLLGMTLALVALAALAGFQAALRFGPASEKGRAIAIGKRALAENTASLVSLARREHHMAAPYALLVRAAVVRAIGAPRTLDGAELDGFLDRVSRTMGASDTYTALADQARAAKTPGDLIEVARSLHRWNQELTRASQ